MSSEGPTIHVTNKITIIAQFILDYGHAIPVALRLQCEACLLPSSPSTKAHISFNSLKELHGFLKHKKSHQHKKEGRTFVS